VSSTEQVCTPELRNSIPCNPPFSGTASGVDKNAAPGTCLKSPETFNQGVSLTQAKQCILSTSYWKHSFSATHMTQAKQSKAKQNKAKQSKAKQSKAKQSKAKQSKAKQRSVPIGYSHNSVCRDDPGLHDVHVLPTDGVIKAEHLSVGGGHLHLAQLSHGTPPLVGNVVDDQQTAGVGHLPMIPVVSLYSNKSSCLSAGKKLVHD